ncbi:rhomboid family intramembrane serine protease [Streptococcus lutetiensis]|uniref:rhomboid family intramembrane serine protease n=1 Tax=Streptococcus lutetiensis TaxID=150055 RepID=UPI001BD97A80|nr:rhomboid family intramembrane serine protease [Streptococcus lutetiensis]MBT0935482.1 rhomboid family intramembrane serine protease [Streptococcus lutetiensis]MBT0937130.1 rhomboid family intramembrane serine protease [Streptococcus lutetiensis]
MKNVIKESPVTIFLLALTTLVFIAMQVIYFGNATSNQAIFNTGGMYGAYVSLFPSQLWRLVTPIFVHIGWEHFFFNALTLYFVGQIAEQIWGHHKFLALYVLSGIVGNIFTLFFTPNVIAAGASTSLFGVFAAIMIAGYFGRNPYLKELGRNYQALIIVNLIFNLFTPSIGIAGHIGGLVGGVLCAIFLPTLVEKNMFKPWQRWLAAATYVGLSLFLIVLALH